jgi:hypothetical protein
MATSASASFSPIGRIHCDERPLDVDAERAGNAHMRLAGGGQGRSQNIRRIGHDGRQEAGDALAPMRRGDPCDGLDRRLGVEQNAASAIDLPVNEAGSEDPAAEIDLLAGARTVIEFDERLDRRLLDDERMIVEKPLSVEEPRSGKDLHCAASLSLATTPPASRIAPSVASYSGCVSNSPISASR